MSTIQVHAKPKHRDFTVISNELIRNPILGIEATMLLIYLLSHSETFSINTSSLSTIFKVGKNKITSISKTLQANKRLYIQKLSTGKTVWHAFETESDYDEFIKLNNLPVDNFDTKPNPQNRDEVKNQQLTEKPHPRMPYMAEPDMANGDVLSNTNTLSNTNLKRKTLSSSNQNQNLPNEFSASELKLDNEFESYAKQTGFTGDIKNEFIKFVCHSMDKPAPEVKDKQRWLYAFMKWVSGAKAHTVKLASVAKMKQQPPQKNTSSMIIHDYRGKKYEA